MTVVHPLWKGRRVRVAGALDQVEVASRDDLAAIYRDYWDLVYRRCYGTLQDREAALDATQDVFVHALNCFEDIRHDIVRGLVDLARTLSYERKRRPAREVSLPNPAGARRAADDPTEIAERHDVLGAVWAGLSPLERRYLADRFAGFSFEEIARRNRRALGTVSSNMARAREHARRMREPMLPSLLGLALWRRLTDLSRRARSAAHSSSLAAAAQPVQTLTISLTLAGLVAGGVPGMLPAAIPAAAGLATVSALGGDVVGGGAGAARVGATSIPPAMTTTASSPRTPQRGAPSTRSTLPLAPATAETPEDTTISSATPSPNYASDHTIIALGYGHACQCNVLLRSTDGGASWTAKAGPPRGDELVLPPDYPHDSRIFVGYAEQVMGATDYWAAKFGDLFQSLPLPGGGLALAAGFDSGDPRIIASAYDDLWSLQWGSGAPTPLVVDASGVGAPSVAAPVGDVATGVLAMTSPNAVTPGTVTSAIDTSPGLKLWACPPAESCHVTGDVALPTGARLTASPEYAGDKTLLAYTTDQALLSSDGGAFEATTLPQSHAYIDRAALGFAESGSVPVWMLIDQANRFELEFESSPSGPWRSLDINLPQSTSGIGYIVPVGPQRVIYTSPATGFLCTADDGLSWSTRCPSA
jgi:RNA polymerase sigma factor (sigma-70 family)